MKKMNNEQAQMINGGKTYYCTRHGKSFSNYASVWNHVFFYHAKTWGSIFDQMARYVRSYF